jgi:folate-binding protein YgfZ
MTDHTSASKPSTPLHGAPETLGGLQAEYRALTAGAAVVDRSYLTRIRHTGRDALDLLHRLSSNDLLSLGAGQTRDTVLTSERGRIIDVLTVVRLAHDELLLLSGASSAQTVMEWIERFTFDEDARLLDITGDCAQVAVAGPEAWRVLTQVAGIPAPGSDSYFKCAVAGQSAEVVRTDAPGLPCWEIIVPVSAARTVLDALKQAGASHASAPAWEAARIERGVPASGHELTGDVNPLEAGLRRLVSFTKGCYVGQEVVARLDTYDRVQRVLAGLLADGPVLAGEALTAEGHEAGIVTSAAYSPALGRQVGLGLVRRVHAAPGSRLFSRSGSVTVHSLPLVR